MPGQCLPKLVLGVKHHPWPEASEKLPHHIVLHEPVGQEYGAYLEGAYAGAPNTVSAFEVYEVVHSVYIGVYEAK